MSAIVKPFFNVQEKFAMYRKVKLKFAGILHKSNFCAICLEEADNYMDMDDFTVSRYWEGSYMVTIHDILKTIFGEKLSSTLCSKQLCYLCITKLRDTYFFILNTQRTAEIINDCIDQINNGLNKTDKALISGVAYDNIVNNLTDPVNHKKKYEIDNDEFDTHFQEDDTEKQDETITFSCYNCNLTFNLQDELRTHICPDEKNNLLTPKVPMKRNRIKKTTSQRPSKILLKQKTIKCPQCKVTNCEHKKYLISWYGQKRVNNHSLIKCIECDYLCADRGLLLAHVNKDHLKKFICVCDQCGASYYSKRALRDHLRNSHTIWVPCKYCSLKFKDMSMLNIHEEVCSKEKRTYQCDECLASFGSKNKLLYHKKTHGASYPCKMCHKTFAAKKLLDKHKLSHFEKGSRTFSCAFCNATFKSIALKKRHEKSEHVTDKPKCELCDIEFTSIKHYKWHQDTVQHLKKLNPAVKFSLECQHCDYTTKTTEMLEAHVNRYHLKITPYECNVCQRKFTGAKLLRGHMKVHEGPQKQCEICGKHVSGPSALKRHTRIHTGEKPYKCDVCLEKFTCAAQKRIHLASKHSVKSVACPLCNSLFYSLSLMRYHFKRVHWKCKEKFDYRKVPGLKEEFYDLFRDRRMLVL